MLRRNALLLTATALPTRMKNKLSTGQRLTAHLLPPDCTLLKNFSNNSGQTMMTMWSREGVLSTTPASTSENELLLLDHHSGHGHHYNGLGKRDWDKPSTLFKRYSWRSYPTQPCMHFIVPTRKEEGVAQTASLLGESRSVFGWPSCNCQVRLFLQPRTIRGWGGDDKHCMDTSLLHSYETTQGLNDDDQYGHNAKE